MGAHRAVRTPDGSVDPPGSAELYLPPVALTHCIRGVITRDTRVLAPAPQGHCNYWPASPLSGLTWMLSGELHVIEPADATQPFDCGVRVPVPDPIFFGGCLTRPLVSCNPGRAHGLTLIFLPDAWHALTGIEPALATDRFVPAAGLLNAEWMDWCHAVAAAPDTGARLDLIYGFLLPRWKALRGGAIAARHWVEDWLDAVLLRAGTSAPGRSLRQIERRIKRWTGQPLRELRGLGRAERAFFEAVIADERGQLDWSQVAQEAGYADQSHMCRQTRRITGFTPDELRRRMAYDEGLWPYRLWGFGELQAPAAARVPQTTKMSPAESAVYAATVANRTAAPAPDPSASK